MDTLATTVAWLVDPTRWQGADGIPVRLLEHLAISIPSIVTAALIALPIGAWIGHTGRHANLAINLAGLGRAIPSYAVLAVVLPISLRFSPDLGLSVIPTFTAMTLLAIPPILVGTYAGLRGVDRDIVEAARGLGLRERQILLQVELPLALSIVAGGLRTASVQVVATATLGAVVAYGGLGRYIIDGIARNENDRLMAGVALVAGLAILVELAFALVQRSLVPRGFRGALDRKRAHSPSLIRLAN
jgi:osmoprotectant transport system permease protein